MFRYISLLVLAFLLSFSAKATHLMAAEITVIKISPTALSYRIILKVYRDNGSYRGEGTADLAASAEIYIPELNITLTAQRQGSPVDVNSFVQLGVYSTDITFPGGGTFTITFSERYRNGCIKNAVNPLGTELYVETQIVVNPFISTNTTPTLLAPPVDFAAIGQKFLHNPAAFDADGDSLSFSILPSKKGPNTNVDAYQPLTDFLGVAEGTGGAGSFGINPQTGTLTWDTPSPTTCNQCFIVAIRIDEWRRSSSGTFIYLGYVIRDMQIIMTCNNNIRPRLTIPNKICVVAGSPISATITATDANNNTVKIEGFSQVLDGSLPAPRATLSPTGFQPVTAAATFNWTPSCDHIRQAPYQVVFKATDNPPPALGYPLVDIQTWEIQVVAPKILNLTATPDNANDVINLNWSAYSCGSRADKLIIWRKDGCNPDVLQPCDTGDPDGQGYIQIGTTDANATAFTDRTARIGLRYTYRVSASFPFPRAGQSIPSDGVCTVLAVDVPFFTEVDVTETSTTTGKVKVTFYQPFQFPDGKPADPFGYDVFRAEGLRPTTATTYTKVFSIFNVNSTDINPISFTDQNLNTQDKAYHYRIAYYFSALSDASKTFKDSSDYASAVRLTVAPQSNCLTLTWEYDTPWSNRGFPHSILRGTSTGGLAQVATVTLINQKFGRYSDTSLPIGTQYFYKTTTRGSYYNPDITIQYPSIATPLVNNSQITNGTPRDVTPPCPPKLTILERFCDVFNLNPPYFNILEWKNATGTNGSAGGQCGDAGTGCEYEAGNIDYFIILYKSTNLESQEYTEIGRVNASTFTFTHNNLPSLAGCYAVKAVDKSGNVSVLSNEVCLDNCVEFLLPNVITPNNDTFNDIFKPMKARFVEMIDFEVYNRWGGRVYARTNDININWAGNEGENEGGSALPAGLYYYKAKVRFYRLNPNDADQTYKGWVQILK